jgi:hypothetical protein
MLTPCGVDVAAGGHAHAALDHRAQVGDDVAEHVGSTMVS